jgi:hypothetical protein
MYTITQDTARNNKIITMDTDMFGDEIQPEGVEQAEEVENADQNDAEQAMGLRVNDPNEVVQLPLFIRTKEKTAVLAFLSQATDCRGSE